MFMPEGHWCKHGPVTISAVQGLCWPMSLEALSSAFLW